MMASWAQVFAWGCNSSGQLGVGDTAARRSPAAVEALWAMPVRSPLRSAHKGSRTMLCVTLHSPRQLTLVPPQISCGGAVEVL